MTRKTIYRDFLVFILLIILVNTALALYSGKTLRSNLYAQGKSDLTQTALLLRGLYSSVFFSLPEEADNFCKSFGDSTETRVTLIATNGVVLGDSQADISLMNNHLDRPEVRAALSGNIGFSVRHSATQNRELMYLALPLHQDSEQEMILRTSMPITRISEPLRSQNAIFIIISLVSVLFTALWSYSIILRIIKPLDKLSSRARLYASGEFSLPPLPDIPAEFRDLSQSLEFMARELCGKMKDITDRKNELAAILSGMTEGVIVLDRDRHVLDINPAAERLFLIPREEGIKKSLLELCRNTELDHFAEAVFKEKNPLEIELLLEGPRKIYLQVHGTRLLRNQAVLVLNNITKNKHLEDIRKDFVANVSHELKTPVTSIKGFIETLLDGAMKDPVLTERFLKILGKQANQIAAIIDDLLILSRIEQSEKTGISQEACNLMDIMANAAEALKERCIKKRIDIVFKIPGTLIIKANAVLLEQALINLLDNGIKYSPEDTEITVKAEKEKGRIKIEVIDQGQGIPPSDLPRIFERFYRVDKGRSRDMGGTGLGLSIVKHIVLAHGGDIFVESLPGRGSTFRIFLPLDTLQV